MCLYNCQVYDCAIGTQTRSYARAYTQNGMECKQKRGLTSGHKHKQIGRVRCKIRRFLVLRLGVCVCVRECETVCIELR